MGLSHSAGPPRLPIRSVGCPAGSAHQHTPPEPIPAQPRPRPTPGAQHGALVGVLPLRVLYSARWPIPVPPRGARRPRCPPPWPLPPGRAGGARAHARLPPPLPPQFLRECSRPAGPVAWPRKSSTSHLKMARAPRPAPPWSASPPATPVSTWHTQHAQQAPMPRGTAAAGRCGAGWPRLAPTAPPRPTLLALQAGAGLPLRATPRRPSTRKPALATAPSGSSPSCRHVAAA
jgi:hypothetical protein